MKKTSLWVFCFFFVLIAVTYSNAESFKILGTRPLSMGGAYVAIAGDALTQYWNPAGLAVGRDVDVQLPIGFQAEFTGNILNSADRLSKLAADYSKIGEAQKNGKSLTLNDISAFAKGLKELDELNKGNKGVVADISGGGDIRIKNIAVSVNNFTSIGADPTIDIKNIGLQGGSFSPQYKASVKMAETYNGVDLDKFITDYGVQTSATIDPSLQVSANTLSTTINDIITKLNLPISSNLDAQKIANAIINAATDPAIAAQLGITALTAAEAKDAVAQIDELNPLLNTILAGATANSSYAKNNSNLTLRGASVVECSLGYGMKVPYVQDEDVAYGIFNGLSAGLNVKYLMGYVAYKKIEVLSNDSSEAGDLFKDFKDDWEQSSAIGLDLGLLLEKRFLGRQVNFGMLLRNINSPSFKQPLTAKNDGEGSNYTIDPQGRFGVAIWPFNWWTISSDLDMTKNSTPLPGYYSRQWGLGNEFNLVNKPWFNIALRAGVMKNLAESTSKLAYTGGFGLNLFHFVIDLGGAFSSDTVEISSGDKIPASASAAATISFNF